MEPELDADDPPIAQDQDELSFKLPLLTLGPDVEFPGHHPVTSVEIGPREVPASPPHPVCMWLIEGIGGSCYSLRTGGGGDAR